MHADATLADVLAQSPAVWLASVRTVFACAAVGVGLYEFLMHVWPKSLANSLRDYRRARERARRNAR